MGVFQSKIAIFFIIFIMHSSVNIEASEISFHYWIKYEVKTNYIHSQKKPTKVETDKTFLLNNVFKELNLDPSFYTDMQCDISPKHAKDENPFYSETRSLNCDFYSPKKSAGYSTSLSTGILCITNKTTGKTRRDHSSLQFARYSSKGEKIAIITIGFSCGKIKKAKKQ